ncbi:MAG: hypothetical protein Q4E53_12345 [Eubacteriales bacterium]|nr:hypothetical protein [Eubacteriales bacterium]
MPEASNKIAPSATMRQKEEYRIDLNLKKGKDLPDQTLKILKQFMESLKKEEYPRLVIYPTDLKGAERGWIMIGNKNEEEKIEISFVIYHGSMDVYHDIFKEKVEEDSYWKQYDIDFLEEFETK